MKALIQVALCGMLAAGGAMAQRGGGGGHMGGGGGGFHGGGMGGAMGGGFHGGGFVGGGFHGGGFNTFHNNTVFVGSRGCCGWGWGWGWGVGLGWGWPYYGAYYPYYGGSYYPDYSYAYPAYQTQPNVTVVYPQTQQAAPTYVERATPVIHEYDQYGQPTGGGTGGSSSPIYLIATRDGSIHAALSYSVNGSSLSYTTIDHQQRTVSLDQVDRDLSDRLNRERRVQFQLPARQ